LGRIFEGARANPKVETLLDHIFELQQK